MRGGGDLFALAVAALVPTLVCSLRPKQWLAQRTLTDERNWGDVKTLTAPERWDPCIGPGRVECPAPSTCAKGKCICPVGTTGFPHCRDEDVCASIPCEHGGTCLQAADALDASFSDQMAGAYFCSCPDDYEGEHCECRVCGPMGTCKPADGSCVCERGFIGLTCEQNEDDCESSPCANGGTCADGIAEYTCKCLLGYMGQRCEVDKAAACRAKPCFNGGICQVHGVHIPVWEPDPNDPSSTEPAYICSCPPQWDGPSCNHHIRRSRPAAHDVARPPPARGRFRASQIEMTVDLENAVKPPSLPRVSAQRGPLTEVQRSAPVTHQSLHSPPPARLAPVSRSIEELRAAAAAMRGGQSESTGKARGKITPLPPPMPQPARQEGLRSDWRAAAAAATAAAVASEQKG